MKRALILLGLFLCGCETTQNTELRASNSLNATYVGRPLSDFIFRNGMNPENMFDMPGGQRVFIFGSPCFSWWHTHRVGTEATPANFIVDSIEIRGYCAT